jgi:hypothetical protein
MSDGRVVSSGPTRGAAGARRAAAWPAPEGRRHGPACGTRGWRYAEGQAEPYRPDIAVVSIETMGTESACVQRATTWAVIRA